MPGFHEKVTQTQPNLPAAGLFKHGLGIPDHWQNVTHEKTLPL